MKRWFLALLMGGLLSGSAAVSVRAQSQPQSGSTEASQQKETSGGKMKSKLGLTDEQVSKIKEARKARQDAVKPLRQQLKEDIAKLRGQIKDKAADSQIQATLEHMKQARKSIQSANEAFGAKMESTLNPTQRAKMLLGMMRRARQGRSKKREGGAKGQQQGENAEESESSQQ
jgi:Spy/CpxP family protein refolding chaperone